ncbi:MAG: hypothetical protein E7279_02625 [Lachnospiraceae bacterium]|nr:hypothetical protein [Lachnospiraceae bacterium]
MGRILQDEKKRNMLAFLVIWGIMTIGLFIRTFDWIANSYNTSILAISYKYGFTSRGLIGTIYQFLGSLLGVDIWNYFVALKFYVICTVVCYIAFAIMMLLFLRRTSVANKKMQQYLILIFTVFFITMFATEKNFGRIDMFMLLATILAIYLIAIEKFVWLVVPLTALGVIFHQGYVFMFYNVVLVLLLYRIFTKEGKNRGKYIAVLIISLVICAALFFWFQIIYRGGAHDYYYEIREHARTMGVEGKPHDELLRAEILGVNLHDEELKYRLSNVIEIIMFIVFFSPYILFVGKVLVRTLKRQTEIKRKLIYLAVILGPLTLLPDYIFKVDFGRWTFAGVSYFLLIFIFMYAVNERDIIESVDEGLEKLKDSLYRPFVFVTPLLFVPFMDIAVTEFTDQLCVLFRNIVGI